MHSSRETAAAGGPASSETEWAAAEPVQVERVLLPDGRTLLLCTWPDDSTDDA